jgi:hypothetical protein
MANVNSTSLINLGELSEPATVLIKKVSDAVGILYEPKRIRNLAKAKSDAAIIRAQSEIEVRTLQRLTSEEVIRQKNIENITRKAIEQLADTAFPNDIDDDWITNFFDKSRIISDQDMQNLWSKVLAEEANKSGSFSRRTVNFLADLDRLEAEKFAKLCRFSWNIGSEIPLVTNASDAIYSSNGVTFQLINELEGIGLVTFQDRGYMRSISPGPFSISYFDSAVSFENEADGVSIRVGQVLFTKVGAELARLCMVEPVAGFLEHVMNFWKGKNPILERAGEADCMPDVATMGIRDSVDHPRFR